MPSEIPVEDKALSISDITAELDKVDEVEDKAEELELEDKEVEKEDEADEKEKEDDEVKLEDDSEKDDELVIDKAPNRKEILKAYPDLFKKFPTIEKAIYREYQYAELFPTLSDAKEAAKEVGEYRDLQNTVLSGDLSGVLSSVKENDPTAFNKIVNNFVSDLGKIDANVRLAFVSKIIKQGLSHSQKVGKSWQGSKNDKQKDDGQQLELAATILHQFMFNEAEVNENVALTDEKPKDPRELEQDKREQEFQQKQLNIARTNVTSRVDTSFRNAVEKAIDPKGLMSDYIKDKAIEDCMNQLRADFREDARFQKVLDKLWITAYQNDFSDQSLKSIRDAILTRGKTPLSTIVSRVRTDALKGKKANGKSQEEEKPKYRSSGSPKKEAETERKAPSKGKSTYDALNEMLG